MDALANRDLEVKAADERRRLEGSVRELRARLEYDFDLRRRIQRRLGLASAASILVGLLSGYWISGAFLRQPAPGARPTSARKRLILGCFRQS